MTSTKARFSSLPFLVFMLLGVLQLCASVARAQSESTGQQSTPGNIIEAQNEKPATYRNATFGISLDIPPNFGVAQGPDLGMRGADFPSRGMRESTSLPKLSPTTVTFRRRS